MKKKTTRRSGSAAGAGGGKRGPGPGATPGRGSAPKARKDATARRAGPSTKRPPWMPEAPAPQRVGRGRPASDPYAGREAARYENPIASREMILALLASADGPLPMEVIAEQLGIDDGERFEALGFRLRAMIRDGQLLQNRKGGFVPAQAVDLIPGVVIANPDGFGFLKPDPGHGDDLFLPPFEMRKVMHGDRVLANVTGIDRRGRREGGIVEILERRLTRLIGRFDVRAGIGFVIPDDRRIQQDILIPPDARGEAQDGQLVVAEITEMPDGKHSPIGRILTVLGDRLTASLAVQAAIHGHDIPHEFPQPVLEQAAVIPLHVDEETALGRVDLRALPLVTIDGEDAKDFDDAVYAEPNRDGFRLVVAIADVSHYVRVGTPLDEEASRRATSVYFPGFVVPMLPETLSNGICSLKPKVDRLCFVCDMQVDRKGVVTSSRFYEAVMHSHARLTYTQVWNAIGDDVTDEARADARERIGSLMPHVENLYDLFHVLLRAREKRGAIEFESGEVRFVLGPQGEVVQAGMLQRNDAHKLIEECMIAANVEAAKFLIERDIPAPYRIHERPPEQKYEDLLEFLKEFGLSLPAWAKVRPKDFTGLLRRIRDRPDAALLESVLLRSQSLAVYAPSNVGHFGLALDAYAHFTSPIRRYADLLVHRAIKHALSGAKPEKFRYSPSAMAQLALECSERSRRADEAQREVDERYRAAWMEQHVGGQFEGVISGVTSFGLFVELDGSMVNGLVHVTQLPNDFYHFDPIRKTLTGERRGREYRLGDRVGIVVLKASVEDRRIDFRLVEEDGVKPLPPRGKPAKRVKQPY
ncbi:ribonuclease R [Lysobacter sp. N42]|uniref:ribonuclease R n=1 Tax=Lysobacter sp. N42 TaxID=2545719 RepID=UPI0010504E50|nr:ribonuclease R [Lysobacter sp. N42]TCZ88126.1 ribonuclease R [Lysobacter sp. N42]